MKYRFIVEVEGESPERAFADLNMKIQTGEYLEDNFRIILVPTKQSESMTTKTECCGKCSHDEDVKCPECGEDKHYRIIYTDDEMTEVDFYDCMVCHTHWSWEHV